MAVIRTQGVRHDLTPNSDLNTLKPGEYGTYPPNYWVIRPPTLHSIPLVIRGLDRVVIFDEGTISVRSYIMVLIGLHKRWLGYLDRGVWVQTNG